MIASNADPRALVDTNIVVYAYDLDDQSKHAVAGVRFVNPFCARAFESP